MRSPGLASTDQNLYFKNDGVWHPFRSVVRLSVVVDILKTPMCLGGAGLKVDRLQLEGKILALFPKHCKCRAPRQTTGCAQGTSACVRGRSTCQEERAFVVYRY